MGTPSVGREYTRPGSWVRGVMLWITAFWEGEGAWEGWLAATVVGVPVEKGEEERGGRKGGRQREGGRGGGKGRFEEGGFEEGGGRKRGDLRKKEERRKRKVKM